MTTVKVSMHWLTLIMLWSVACTSVLAQESGAIVDSIQSNNDAAARSEPATKFHLKGVLISRSGRSSALVNNRVFIEGDRVAGAEILAIKEGAVQILVGSREFTVPVGSTAVAEQLSGSTIGKSHESTRPRINRKRNPPVATPLFPDSTLAQFNSDERHRPVKQGETLSDIAQHYLSGGVTMNQVMIALFQANPQAFGDNINILYEGAILRIPDQDELHFQSPELAMAVVVRHMDAWRTGHQQRIRLSKVIDSRQYGPVSSGETLSGIAVQVARNGATMNQMMMALFRANPQAFGGNINTLHSGAILRIPDEHELHDQSPELAMAEVVRHMDTWRTGSWQELRSTSAHAYMTASSRAD